MGREWLVYVLLGSVGLLGTSLCLRRDWHGPAMSNAFAGASGPGLGVGGDEGGGLLAWALDGMVLFWSDCVGSEGGASLYYSHFAFVGALIWSFTVEASRRRVSLRQVLTALFPLLAMSCASLVVPLFLAALNAAAPRQVAHNCPAYDLSVNRAFVLLLCNVGFLVLWFLAVPSTATAWPGGHMEPSILAMALVAPAVPALGFAADATGRGAFYALASAAEDREFAHYLVMFSSVLIAIVGLFVHLHFWSCVVMAGSLAAPVGEMLGNGATSAVLLDWVVLVVAAYFWLEVEAMTPVHESRASRDAPSRLLQWRDCLAIVIFGPTCHFAIAFAGREFGLLRLDNMRVKSA